MNTNILIGADPEVFLRKGSSLVSAHDMMPGSKYEPFFVDKGAIQVDGVAAEFNIFPAENADEFVGNIRHVMAQMLDIIHSNDEEVGFAIQPTAHFDPDYFFNLPGEVLALGCEPDYSAYTMEPNPKPHTDRPFRTGAGHIHIGWTQGANPQGKGHFALCAEIVRALDETLYEASLKWDADEERRSLYGAKGSFRPKSYGVEYRPLSNMILSSDEILKYVFNITKSVATSVLQEQAERVAA